MTRSLKAGARRILMVVAYRARDLPGHALIGYHLERAGHEVIYTNGYGIESKLLSASPHVLVLDHLAWNHKVEQARLARSLGIRVIIVPTEGLFPDPSDVVEAAGGLFAGAADLIDAHLSWGPFHKRAIVDSGFLPAHAAPVTGCQRFDAYADPFTRMCPPRSGFVAALGLPDPERPLVVWCTNTPWVGRDRDVMIARHVRKANWTEERAIQNWEDENTQFREHGAAVVRLADLHPEWNFVIKVHPGEGIASYEPMARARPNLVVAFDAPIRDFLFHGDTILQRNCTTATEAWMLGKPALQLDIGEYHRDGGEMLRRGNQTVSSFQEMEQGVVQALAGAPIPSDVEGWRSDFLEDYYSSIDGGSAARIASEIHHRATGESYPDSKAAAAETATLSALSASNAAQDARWQNRLKDLLHLDRSKSLRPFRRFRSTAGDTTLGRFEPEIDISPEMVRPLYELYDSLPLRSPAPANGFER